MEMPEGETDLKGGQKGGDAAAPRPPNQRPPLVIPASSSSSSSVSSTLLSPFEPIYVSWSDGTEYKLVDSIVGLCLPIVAQWVGASPTWWNAKDRPPLKPGDIIQPTHLH